MLMFKFEHKLFLKHKIAEFETLEKEDIGKFFFLYPACLISAIPLGFFVSFWWSCDHSLSPGCDSLTTFKRKKFFSISSLS